MSGKHTDTTLQAAQSATTATTKKRATGKRVYDTSEVVGFLEAAVKKAGGVRAFAREIGVNHSWVSNTLRGNVHPSGTVMTALGFQRIKGYERIPDGDE